MFTEVTKKYVHRVPFKTQKHIHSDEGTCSQNILSDEFQKVVMNVRNHFARKYGDEQNIWFNGTEKILKIRSINK